MLQPRKDKKHIHESSGKANIQYFFNLNLKSAYVIYLMGYIICNIEYVGKAETAFNPLSANPTKWDSIPFCDIGA